MQVNAEKSERKVLNTHPTAEELLELRQNFRPGSIAYMLCTIDWSKMTYKQIAQALDASQSRVQAVVYRIRDDFGIVIPHKTSPRAWSKPWYRKKQKELGIGNSMIKRSMLHQ